MRILFAGIFLGIFFPVVAQFTIRFNVYDPAQKIEIFLAGTFNNWNPGNKAYKLIDLDATHKYITLRNIPTGEYSFKFTRGNWNTVENTETGGNRIIQINRDTVVQCNIAGWSDDIKKNSGFAATGKFTIRFEVYDPANKPGIFLTGTFNGFDPGDNHYKLQTNDSLHQTITLHDISPGKYSFKFTRGNWGTVESNEYGGDIDDRLMEITHDTAIKVTIAGWMDGYFDLTALPDTIQVRACWIRSSYYSDINLDSSYKYGKMSLEISKNISDKRYEVGSSVMLGSVYQKQGNSAKALELFLQASPVAEAARDSFRLTTLFKAIGNLFESEKEYAKAISYYINAIKYCPSNEQGLYLNQQNYLSLGKIYFNKSDLDSSKYYAYKSKEFYGASGAFLLLGDIEKKAGNQAAAMADYRQAALAESRINTSSINLAGAYLRIAAGFTENNQADSGFYYARLSLAIAKKVNNPFAIRDASALLSKVFASVKKYDSAFYFQQIVLNANDSLFNKEKENQLHNLVYNDQLQKQEIQTEKEKLRSRTWIYTLGGGLLILLLTSVLLIRNNRQKREANNLLEKQKHTIENTLSELKSTQSQLIQSEKMASLGELTAGIAHEIQNPLNFVNNFSELNKELLAEMNDEIEKENYNDVKAIAKDISENEEKINHHGKRADAIVKGMLQHSRSSNGVKEPTDINDLCDEYLRLSYHVLRAKDNSFSATIKTDYDKSIGVINIIPQDIGRVVLNLVNNAFYAVGERSKAESPDQSIGAVTEKKKHQGENYKPTVSITTKKINGKVEVSVSDNGNGISQNIADKIFQPFFTTKPTGKGTGLGLSLSYDIIKAHGGEIKVETLYAEASAQAGTTFIIQLPANN